jgi:hypothetical protein
MVHNVVITKPSDILLKEANVLISEREPLSRQVHYRSIDFKYVRYQSLYTMRALYRFSLSAQTSFSISASVAFILISDAILADRVGGAWGQATWTATWLPGATHLVFGARLFGAPLPEKTSEPGGRCRISNPEVHRPPLSPI